MMVAVGLGFGGACGWLMGSLQYRRVSALAKEEEMLEQAPSSRSESALLSLAEEEKKAPEDKKSSEAVSATAGLTSKESPLSEDRGVEHSYLSDEELRSRALDLAKEIRALGKEWKEATENVTSGPPPNSDDSVEPYINSLDKLSKLQHTFDEKYKSEVTEIEQAVLERLPDGEQPTAAEALVEKVETADNAVQKLERLAQLL